MPSSGVRVHATFEVKETMGGALKDAVKALVDATRKEPGCIEFELFRELGGDGKNFAVIEHWKDEDSHAAHLKSAHLTAFKEQAKAHMAGGGVNVKKFAPVPI
jgi:quinol monooxygenase YgiN